MVNQAMTVAQIVLEHSECAPVLQRHRIDYCCKGEWALTRACEDRGLDAAAVLEELERAIAGRREPPGIDPRAVPTRVLVDHIVGRHHAYLKDALPFLAPLAVKVARVHGAHNAHLLDVRDAVAELADLLPPHLEREEQVLFPALVDPSGRGAKALIAAELESMHADHLEVARLLERLRDAAHDFHLPDWACASYRTLFRELQAVETDLFQHVHLENHVLMPRFANREDA